MAYFVILDCTANLVESFDQESEARDALETIVQQDPDSAEEYAILKYDDNGNPVGQAVTGAQLNTPV